MPQLNSNAIPSNPRNQPPQASLGVPPPFHRPHRATTHRPPPPTAPDDPIPWRVLIPLVILVLLMLQWVGGRTTASRVASARSGTTTASAPAFPQASPAPVTREASPANWRPIVSLPEVAMWPEARSSEDQASLPAAPPILRAEVVEEEPPPPVLAYTMMSHICDLQDPWGNLLGRLDLGQYCMAALARQADINGLPRADASEGNALLLRVRAGEAWQSTAHFASWVACVELEGIWLDESGAERQRVIYKGQSSPCLWHHAWQGAADRAVWAAIRDLMRQRQR